MDCSPKLMLILVLIFCSVIQFSEGEQTLCQVPLSGLVACKPAVTAPNPAPPSATCCGALVHADFNCLCNYKKAKILSSFGVDPDLAFQLPQKCNLTQTVNCT